MKKISIFVILLVIIGAIFYFWPDKNTTPIEDTTADGPYRWTLTFEFSEDESKDIKMEWEERLSLATITEKIAGGKAWDFDSQDYGDMGVLITQIKDKKNGDDQKYWQFFVDGEQPQISADKYFPEGGTHIDWKFMESEF